jgi:transcriptional regulator with XRE-family HTH domain
MELNNRVRRRLKALMQEHGLSQTGLARAAHQRQQDVNRFMSARSVYPSLHFLDQLARVFQYTLADLLAADLPQPSLTSEELTLLVGYRATKNPVHRSAVMALLETSRKKTRNR